MKWSSRVSCATRVLVVNPERLKLGVYCPTVLVLIKTLALDTFIIQLYILKSDWVELPNSSFLSLSLQPWLCILK